VKLRLFDFHLGEDTSPTPMRPDVRPSATYNRIRHCIALRSCIRSFHHSPKKEERHAGRGPRACKAGRKRKDQPYVCILIVVSTAHWRTSSGRAFHAATNTHWFLPPIFPTRAFPVRINFGCSSQFPVTFVATEKENAKQRPFREDRPQECMDGVWCRRGCKGGGNRRKTTTEKHKEPPPRRNDIYSSSHTQKCTR